MIAGRFRWIDTGVRHKVPARIALAEFEFATGTLVLTEAVHGRYRELCPVCGTPVQRIRHRGNETNYCANCPTEGRLQADRALSRLLKQDWPKTVEELEG